MEAIARAEAARTRERAVRLLSGGLDAALVALAASMGGGIAPIQISLAVVLLAVIALEALGERVLRPTVIGPPLLLLLTALAVGVLAAPGKRASLLGPDAWGIYRVCAGVFLVAAVRDVPRAFRLAVVFVLAAAAQGIYGLVQYHTGVDVLAPFHRSLLEPVPDAADRFLVKGTYNRPSTFSFVAAAGIACMIGGLLSGAVRGRRELALAALVAPVAAGALYTFYGTTAAAFVFGLLAMAVVGRQMQRTASVFAALGIGATMLLSISPPLRAALFDHLQAPGISVAHADRWVKLLGSLSRHAASGIGARNLGVYPQNNFLLLWVQSGPVALLAFFWLVSATLASLRRAAKLAPAGAAGAPTRAIVLGAAGVLGCLVAWCVTQDPLMDGVVTYAFTFCVSLGLAAALPATPDPLVAGQVEPGDPPTRWSAAIAACAMGAASIAAAILPGKVTTGQGTAAALLLGMMGVAYLPLTPAWIAGRLRRIVPFVAVAMLVGRPFSAQDEPGSGRWWTTAAAGVAVAALVAGIAGAVHAIRRPGRVGPAPVAGALMALFAALFTLLLEVFHLVPLRSGAGTAAFSYNFVAGAFAVGLFFVAWSGPLAFGEVRVQGTPGRLVRLPVLAGAAGLAVLVALGWT